MTKIPLPFTAHAKFIRQSLHNSPIQSPASEVYQVQLISFTRVLTVCTIMRTLTAKVRVNANGEKTAADNPPVTIHSALLVASTLLC